MCSTILLVIAIVAGTISTTKIEEKNEEIEEENNKKVIRSTGKRSTIKSTNEKQDLVLVLSVADINNALININFTALPGDSINHMLWYRLEKELPKFSIDFNQMNITNIDEKEKTFDLVAKDNSKDYIGKVQLKYTIDYDHK